MGKKAKARDKERDRRKGDPPHPVRPAAPADRQQLATRLNTVAIHLLRRLSREDAALDLTPARLSALSVLAAGGPITLGSLSRAEHVTAPSMTRLVTAMARDGLVERIPSAQDGRKVFVRVTSAGLSVLGAGQDRRVAALITWLSPVGADGLHCLDDASVLLESLLRDERS